MIARPIWGQMQDTCIVIEWKFGAQSSIRSITNGRY